MLIRRARHRRARPDDGFTILEIMVTLGIFAVLIAVGVPTMRTWISNTKVRAVADALQNGVRLAQAESLRRSRQVIFSLTNSTTPQTSVAAVGGGSNWSINTVPSMTDGSETAATSFVEYGVLTTSSLVSISGPASICFNSAGRLVGNTTSGVSNVTGGATCALPTGTPPVWTYDITMAGADRRLRVTVALGGQTHMCDPNKTLSLTNPDGC